MDWNVWHWIGLPSRKDIRELTPFIRAENSKCLEVVQRELRKLTAELNSCVAVVRQTQSAIEKECELLLRQIRRGMTDLGMQMHNDSDDGKKCLSELLDAGLAKLETAQRASEREFSKMAKDLLGVVEAVESQLKNEAESRVVCINRLTAATKDASKSLQQDAAHLTSNVSNLVGDCRSAVAAVLDQEKVTTSQMDKIVEQFDAMQEVLRLYMINAVIDSIPVETSATPREKKKKGCG